MYIPELSLPRMLISLSWLKELLPTSVSGQEMADKLSVSGLEVEHHYTWESVPGGLRGFVIGQVTECAKHPNADKLSVTRVDIGTGELQPIVCGAPNVAAGQKVIVALPGTEVTVPGKGTFTIGEAKIRGEVSRGMICAEDECGLGSSHDGILVLPDDAPVGLPAASYFKVASDELLEIGLTANRGDAASHLGVARDLAALLDTPVTLPAIPERSLQSGPYRISCQADECSHYVALQLSGVSAAPSPDWMQNRLRALGIEPRNILVDATNYVLHTLGQPIHAFDAARLNGKSLTVRTARAGEKFSTLDKQDRELKGHELIIADEAGPVALAGVIGGLESSVTAATTEIVIESAHFNPSRVRKTARAHQLNTDASFRFERSTDPRICLQAALYTADLIMAVCGGQITGMNECVAAEWQPRTVSLDLNWLRRFAGADISDSTAMGILQRLGFGTGNPQEGICAVQVPSWRNDVEQPVDLAEEIMRIHGYDQVPMDGKMQVSLGSFEGTRQRQLTEKVRHNLQAGGFYEIVNNSLTAASNYEEDMPLVRLTNPLSSDMAVMRASMLHGMLQAAQYNRNRKHADLKFFEFGRVYATGKQGFEETDMLALLITGHRTAESWEQKQEKTGYYDLKAAAVAVLQACGSTLNADDWNLQAVEPNLLKKYDIDTDVWYGEISWNKVLGHIRPSGFRVAEPPRFPGMRRDLSLVVDKSTPYATLEKVALNLQIPILQDVHVFDVFEGKPLEDGKKAIAMSFALSRADRTLTDTEADEAMNTLMQAFEKQAGAVIRK